MQGYQSWLLDKLERLARNVVAREDGGAEQVDVLTAMSYANTGDLIVHYGGTTLAKMTFAFQRGHNTLSINGDWNAKAGTPDGFLLKEDDDDKLRALLTRWQHAVKVGYLETYGEDGELGPIQ